MKATCSKPERLRQVEQLDGWLEEYLTSGIPDLHTFAESLKREYSTMKVL